MMPLAWSRILKIGPPGFLYREQSDLAKYLIGVTLGSAGIRVAGMALSFLVGVQLARYLGPEQYGIYGVAIAAVAIASVAVTFGVPPLTTREAALAVAREEWASLKGVLRWSAMWVCGTSLILVLIGATAIYLMPIGLDESGRWIAIAALGLLPVYALTSLVGAAMRGTGSLIAGQTLDGVFRPAFLSALLLVAVLAFGTVDATQALFLHLAAGLAALVIGAVWLVSTVPSQARGVNAKSAVSQWIRGALPMGAADLLRVLEAHFVLIVLASMVPAVEVGVFRVALGTAVFVMLPYALFGTITVPIVAKLSTDGDLRRLQRFAATVAVLVSGSVFALTAFLWVEGLPLIRFVFGPEYAGAWTILMVLCLAQLAIALTGISAGALNARGHERLVTAAFATSLVVGLILAILLAHAVGAIGAAWATVVAALVRSLMLHRWTKLRVGIDPSILAARSLLSLKGA
jgi:O-antigen/teichoic acid export membrane protein